MTAPLSPEEAATVERFNAADAAPESLRERVARAMWDVEMPDTWGWDHADEYDRGEYYRIADAAIAVIRGDS